MVDRRRLARIKADLEKGGVVIDLEDGTTQVFPMDEALALEFLVDLVDSWEAGIAAERGEEHEWRDQTGKLKQALDNATPASRSEFYANYTPAVAWEEDIRRRDTNESVEEE